MSPTSKKQLEDDVEELEEDVEGLSADPQSGPGTPTQQEVVVRAITLDIDINVETEDPDVTDEQIATALKEQVTFPTTIWISKGIGQTAVKVVSTTETPEPPPAP